MEWIAEALRGHPELALFLVLALGHALGALRVGVLQIGPVIGVLVAGVAVGQLGIDAPQELGWTFFYLFLFSIGYRTGPQFFASLGANALPQLLLSVLLCSTGLAATFGLSVLLGFDAGTTGGLFAGALNASAAVGTANNAIANLPLDEGARVELGSGLAIAFAVTYLVGLLTTVATLSRLGPWLMGVDLAEDCRELERELGVPGDEDEARTAYQAVTVRAYAIPDGLAAKSAAELEAAFAPERAFVERVRHGEEIVESEPGTPLRPGDRVALAARSELLLGANNPLRQHEVEDRALLEIPTALVDVVLDRRELQGDTLERLAARLEREVATRGVFVQRIARGGQELPRGPLLVLERGDVLTLAGARRHVERVADRIGSALWPSPATDMIGVAAAIAIGGLVGLPALRIASFDVGLSLPVGILLGGMLLGRLQSLRAGFGRVPGPALWVFDSLGLTGFLALVGLEAGPQFVRGLSASGPALVGAGLLVAGLPHLVAILVGHRLLGMRPGVLLGVCAGAGTSPAALAAVQDRAHSRVPALGYAMSYAVGNVLLALFGSVVVALRG